MPREKGSRTPSFSPKFPGESACITSFPRIKKPGSPMSRCYMHHLRWGHEEPTGGWLLVASNTLKYSVPNGSPAQTSNDRAWACIFVTHADFVMPMPTFRHAHNTLNNSVAPEGIG